MGVINYTTAKINELLAKIEKAPETIENGKTPVFVTGTTTTLDPGLSATAEVVQDGVDENGNPKYKINFGVPKGLDGASGGGGGTADSVQWSNILNMPSWVNSATKPSYTASEVGALPADTTIPSKTSQLTNDSNFLTSGDFKTINGQSIVGSGNIQIEGGSSGGTGNVNVTNASGLLNSRLYSFKPSKEGSLEGTFQEIDKVNETTAGLMRSEDYSKLKTIKGCVYLPIDFEQVNSSTSKEELVQLFSKAFKQEDLNFAQLVLILSTFSTLSDSDGNGDSGAKFFVGNNECLFRGLYTEAENKLLTEFTYIAIGGKLKTISILFSNLESQEPSEVELSISIKESGDDKIYLSSSIFSLSASSTIDDVYSVFGGKESFTKIFLDRDNSDKSFFILYPNSSRLFWYSKPAFVEHLYPFTHWLNIITFEGTALKEVTFIRRLFISLSTDGTSVRSITNNIFYLNGKILDKEVYYLTESSSSDEISSAIGGEDGLKSIIKSVKCGNKLKISGVEGEVNYLVDLSVWCATENENGDLNIAFVGFGYNIFGTGLGGMLTIAFTKSTNEFVAQVAALSFS